MKKLFFTIALLFSFVFVFAQESSYTGISADEGIIGFYGIPFGTNKETVIKMMKKKGWSKGSSGIDEEFGDYIGFIGGTYASKKISGFNKLTFFFYNDEFYMSNLSYGIDYKSKKKDEDAVWVKNVIDGTVAKYNLKLTSESEQSKTYEGANKNKLKLITNANEYTLWCYIRTIDFERMAIKFILKFAKEAKEANSVVNSDDL